MPRIKFIQAKLEQELIARVFTSKLLFFRQQIHLTLLIFISPLAYLINPIDLKSIQLQQRVHSFSIVFIGNLQRVLFWDLKERQALFFIKEFKASISLQLTFYLLIHSFASVLFYSVCLFPTISLHGHQIHLRFLIVFFSQQQIPLVALQDSFCHGFLNFFLLLSQEEN